jgi:hypothetical protein
MPATLVAMSRRSIASFCSFACCSIFCIASTSRVVSIVTPRKRIALPSASRKIFACSCV